MTTEPLTVGATISVRITLTKYHAVPARVTDIKGRCVSFVYLDDAPIFAGLRGQLTLPKAVRVREPQ